MTPDSAKALTPADGWRSLPEYQRVAEEFEIAADWRGPSRFDPRSAMLNVDALCRSLAASPDSAPAQEAVRESDQQLMRFYSVDTLHELIDKMDRHIERLQAKLPPLRDEFPRTPRVA